MADKANQIDEIVIKINGTNESALNAINTVTDRLTSLRNSIASVNSANTNNFANSVDDIVKAFSRINKNDLSGLNRYTNALKRLQDLDTDGIQSKIQPIADAIKELSSSVKSADFSKSLVNGLNAISRFSNAINAFSTAKSATVSSSINEVSNALKETGFDKGLISSINAITRFSKAIMDFDNSKVFLVSSAIKAINAELCSTGFNKSLIDGLNAIKNFVNSMSKASIQGALMVATMIRDIATRTVGLSFSEGLIKGLNAIARFVRVAGSVTTDTFVALAAGIRAIAQEAMALNSIDVKKLDALATAMKYSTRSGKSAQAAVNKAVTDLGNAQAGGKNAQRGSQASPVSASTTNAVKSYNSHVKAATKSTHRFKASIKSASHASRGLGSSLKRLVSDFMRILKYRMLRSFIRMITQSFTTGIKNAYQYAVQTGNQFQATMDRMATTALYVKNSLGAMAMPLLNTLAPALDYVADKFVALLNTINQFIASITGQATWTKALRYTKSFGEGTENAANGAKKAADDLKATILGIDEINLLNDNKEKAGSGSGGGAAADDYSAMFETVETKASKFSQTLSDLFKPFQDAWDNQGSKVMESWRYSTSSIKSLLVEVGDTFKNVWTDGTGQRIVENLLQSFTNINTAIGNIATNLKTAWEENGRGQRIAEAIGGIVEDISGFVEGITASTASWASNLDFGPLLDSIGNLSEKFKEFAGILEDKFKWVWDNILLPFGEWAIEEGLPKTIDALGSAFETLGTVLDKVWPGVEKILIFLRDNAFDAFEDFVDAFKNFSDAIKSLFELDLETGFKNLKEGFGNLGDLASNPLVLLLLGKASLSNLLGGGTGAGVTTGAVGAGAVAEGSIFGPALLWFGQLAAQWKMVEESAAAGKQAYEEAMKYAEEHGLSLDELKLELEKNDPFRAPENVFKKTIELEGTGTTDSAFERIREVIVSKVKKKNLPVKGQGTMDTVMQKIYEIFGVEEKTIDLGYQMDGTQNNSGVKTWLNTVIGNFKESVLKKLGYNMDGTEKNSNTTLWFSMLPGKFKESVLKKLGYNMDGTEKTSAIKTWIDTNINKFKDAIKKKLGYFLDGSEKLANIKAWIDTVKDKFKESVLKKLGYKLDGTEKDKEVTSWLNLFTPSGGIFKTLGYKLDGSEKSDGVKKWWEANSSTISKTLALNLKLKVEAIAAGKGASDGNTSALNILEQRLTYAQGGFPASGQVYFAREDGSSEYIGKFGNHAAVANNDQIVEGIAQGVSAAQAEQNRLLREQNELLRAIYDKEGNGSSATSSDVLRALTQTSRRTGHPVVSMG